MSIAGYKILQFTTLKKEQELQLKKMSGQSQTKTMSRMRLHGIIGLMMIS